MADQNHKIELQAGKRYLFTLGNGAKGLNKCPTLEVIPHDDGKNVTLNYTPGEPDYQVKLSKTIDIQSGYGSLYTIGSGNTDDLQLDSRFFPGTQANIRLEGDKFTYEHCSNLEFSEPIVTDALLNRMTAAGAAPGGELEQGDTITLEPGKHYRFTYGTHVTNRTAFPVLEISVDANGKYITFQKTSAEGVRSNPEAYDISLMGDQIIIGRSRAHGSNVIVDDNCVSRKQAVIQHQNGILTYTHRSQNKINSPEVPDLDAPHLARPTMEPENRLQGAPHQEAGGESLRRLESGYEYTYHYPRGTILKLEVNGTEVTATYTDLQDPNKNASASADLQREELTIGRDLNNTLIVVGNDGVSRKHAVISRSISGAITCSHATARNKPQAPDVKKIERKPDMWHDGGDGAGVCEDNPCIDPKTGERGNPRSQNEDRGLVMNAPDFSAGAATAFLEAAFDAANKATENMNGGSTLSAVMATTDGKYACAHVGDSPIYIVGYNPHTRKAKLVQVNFPHNMQGMLARGRIPDEKKDNEISFDKAIELYAQNKPVPSSSMIFGYLGPMSRGEKSLPPDFQKITPQIHLPDGFEFKGMMVCSDGVQLSDENHYLTREAAEQALSFVFTQNNSPDPQAIAYVMVGSAMPDPNDPDFKHSKDNITAVFLPAGGKGLIAVADGNTGTAQVAEKAIEVLHERCIAAMQAQGKAVGIVSDGSPKLGAQAPAHEVPPDIRQGTEPPRDEKGPDRPK